MEYSWRNDIGKTLLLTFFNFIVVSIIIFVLVHWGYFVRTFISPHRDATIVFVTAHPDDECMFFGPTILQTVKNSNNVHLLCLTTGNFYNKGPEREKELFESCKVLGIPATNVDILNNSSFPDGNSEWAFDVLLPELLQYIRRVKPDYIFTFDQYGVSSHLNHIATSTAVRKLHGQFKSGEKIPTILELESVPLYRKYISFMDTPMSVIGRQFVFVSSPSDVLKTQRAMLAHRTQLVWFRRLYIVFSRYMLINTFKEVTADSVI